MLGLATTKPLLGLVGLIIGHQFDRGFATFQRGFDDQGGTVGSFGDGYVRVLFRTAGHLAKVDGRVSEDEIRAARSVMHRLGLGPQQVRYAINWFNEGKEPAYQLVQGVRELRRVHARNADQRTIFVRLLLEVALAKKRVQPAERAMIWTVCTELDIGRVELAQLEAMIRAQKGFRHSPAGDADAARIRSAYETLGVGADATNKEVKTAYRRLMNRNHPDKLSASDPGPEVIAEAERRTREVRTAYELLKARRAIR